MKKISLVVLSAAMLSLFIAGCGFTGGSETVNTTDNGTKLSDDYKTFQSKKLGFTFDYPADFTGDIIEDEANEQILVLNSNDCVATNFGVTGTSSIPASNCIGLLAIIETQAQNDYQYKTKLAGDFKLQEYAGSSTVNTDQSLTPKDTGSLLIVNLPKVPRLEIYNKKDRIYIFTVESDKVSMESKSKVLAHIADTFVEITPDTQTWNIAPLEKGSEISFDSCGSVDKYKDLPFYTDFYNQLTAMRRQRTAQGILFDTGKIAEKDVTAACYSEKGGILMALMTTGEYCNFGGILKYDIPSKLLSFAEDTQVRKVDKCLSLSSIGKRHGKQVDIRAATGDAGVSVDATLNYDYNNNYLVTKKVCITSTTDFIKGTTKTECHDYPLVK